MMCVDAPDVAKNSQIWCPFANSFGKGKNLSKKLFGFFKIRLNCRERERGDIIFRLKTNTQLHD